MRSSTSSSPPLLQSSEVTHVYGLTEVYGPAALCEWRDAWTSEGVEAQARLKARQGVSYITQVRNRQRRLGTECPTSLASYLTCFLPHVFPTTQEAIAVLDDAGNPVPPDGETLGEVCFRGNMVMKGYYKDEEATKQAFRGGWFRTGDLGVTCPDGYVALKDRAKDIVISGGENISSIELEGVLYHHPDVRQPMYTDPATPGASARPVPPALFRDPSLASPASCHR